ncbi:MAG: transketolase C-terminal domain-containing protein, partial [Vicinamibacteria bacterium]
YSVKPVDAKSLQEAAEATKRVVTVEDHSVCGGIGEAVASAVAGRARVEILGIRHVPRSGKPGELIKAHGIDAGAIVEAVKRLL